MLAVYTEDLDPALFRVVLASPRNPLNIGAVARAMSNFGLTDLRLVDAYRVAVDEARSATHAGEVVTGAREFPGIAEAVGDATLVVGTSSVGKREMQLPLYRHLYRALLPLPIGDVRKDGVELGYITLPKDAAGVNAHFAKWTPDELKAADAEACRVIRDLRAGKFWPPNETPPAFEDEFSAICQDQALGRALAAKEGQ